MEYSGEENRRFSAIYREHVEQVFRLCMRMGLGDRGWAEDRTQEVFVTLAENTAKLQRLESIGGWLRRVAINACLMDLRRRSRWRTIRQRLVPTGQTMETPHHAVEQQREAADLRRAIEALPARLREVITLTYLMDCSQAEAAEMLGISKGELSKRHKKALQRLRKLHGRSADDPGA